MHFEILVEDSSGAKAVEILSSKIITADAEHTFRVISYKGIGHIPNNLQSSSDPKKRILLDRLPQLIRGYDNTYPDPIYSPVVIVVCDLDERCFREFRRELLDCLAKCAVKLNVYFCIAIEEMEAWYLGDINAIKSAYPRAKDKVLNSYVPDSICGTWEKLADAVFPGGAKKLSRSGGPSEGEEKATWAKNISPHINVDSNQSPSFCYFRDKLRGLAKID